MRPFLAYLRALPADLGGSLGALIWTGAIYRAIGLVVFAPLTGLLLNWSLTRAGRTVLIDQEIAAFLLEPFGALAALVMISLALTLIALEQGCLMTILHSRAVGAARILRFVLGRAPSIFALAARVVLGALLRASPFVAVGGLVYLWLLTDYDSNDYLAERPPAYILALSLAAVIGTGLVGTLLIAAAFSAATVAIYETRSGPGTMLVLDEPEHLDPAADAGG